MFALDHLGCFIELHLIVSIPETYVDIGNCRPDSQKMSAAFLFY